VRNTFFIFLALLLAFFTLFSVVPAEAGTPPDDEPEPPEFISGGGFPDTLGVSYGYDQSTAPNAPILLRQAPFVPYDGREMGAWGNVQHRRVGADEVIRLTPNFRLIQKGPAVLAFTASAIPREAEIAAAVKLDLQSAAGAQEYRLPADLNFNAVAVYDQKTEAVLAIARLEPEPLCDQIPSRSALSVKQPGSAPKTCLAIDPTTALNKTGTPPTEVNIDDYRLLVDGFVENPLELTFEQLKQYPSTSEVVLLICSGFFADNVEWTGTPVSAILEAARPKPDFKALRITSGSDGYWVNLEREDYDFEQVILAYQVNGEGIPLEHGYPVRLVIKDEYGAKWVKWVKHIEVLEK